MTKKVYEQKYFSLSWIRIQTGKFQLRISLLLKDKMVLRMKNFDIFGVHWKIQLLGKVHEKPIYRGDCLKKGLGQFVNLRGWAWQEWGSGVFEGGWYPNAHYDNLESVS